jgi:hypothetical protein
MAAMNENPLAAQLRDEALKEFRGPTQSYDAPPMPSGLVDLIQPIRRDPTTLAEFLTFKPGTEHFNHKTAKGRARRS